MKMLLFPGETLCIKINLCCYNSCYNVRMNRLIIIVNGYTYIMLLLYTLLYLYVIIHTIKLYSTKRTKGQCCRTLVTINKIIGHIVYII